MKKILNPKPVKKAVKKSVKRTGRALVNNNPPMEKLISKAVLLEAKPIPGTRYVRLAQQPKTLKSISVKSAGFVKLLKNQDKEIWWQCKSNNGEILSTCEGMSRKIDVINNAKLTIRLLRKLIESEKKKA